MLAMMAAMGIGRFVYTPILPIMVDDLGLEAAQAGMVASINFLGYLIGAMIAATSWLRGSRRVWLLGSLMASALTTVVMGFADSYSQFLLIRFVGGLVSAWVLVFASNLVLERLIACGRSDLTAVHFGGVGLGIAFSAVLTAVGGSDGDAWRAAWWISGGVAVLIALMLIPLVPGEPVKKVATADAPAASPGGISGLLWAYGLFGFGYVITATFLIELVRSGMFSVSTETVVWVTVGLAGAPSIWFWNRIAKHFGNTTTFSIACLVEAVGVAASIAVGSLASLFVTAILLGGTFMGITALGLVEARKRSSRDPRATLAMMTAAFGVGQIIGPTVAGYLRDITGSFTLPTAMAALALLLAAAAAQYRAS